MGSQEFRWLSKSQEQKRKVYWRGQLLMTEWGFSSLIINTFLFLFFCSSTFRQIFLIKLMDLVDAVISYSIFFRQQISILPIRGMELLSLALGLLQVKSLTSPCQSVMVHLPVKAANSPGPSEAERTTSYHHRIKENLGLEGTFKGHLVQLQSSSSPASLCPAFSPNEVNPSSLHSSVTLNSHMKVQ